MKIKLHVNFFEPLLTFFYLDATSGGQAETIATAVQKPSATLEDISDWDGLTVLEEKIFDNDAIERMSKVNYIWKKYNIKMTLEETIDLYCERLTPSSLQPPDQLICLRSEIKYSKHIGAERKAFIMTRDMSLLLFMERNSMIREDHFMPKFLEVYKSLHVGQKDSTVKKFIRDVWRGFAKSSGGVNKKVWKLNSKGVIGGEGSWDDHLLNILREKWKDEYVVLKN